MAPSTQTGFDRLKDDKGFQDHWAKRVIAYIIDVVIISVAAYFLVLVVAFPALPAFFFGQVFPLAWFWGFWLGGIALLIVLAYFVLAGVVRTDYRERAVRIESGEIGWQTRRPMVFVCKKYLKDRFHSASR